MEKYSPHSPLLYPVDLEKREVRVGRGVVRMAGDSGESKKVCFKNSTGITKGTGSMASILWFREDIAI